MELWMRKVEGPATEMFVYASSIRDMAPHWYLHGITLFEVDEDAGVCTGCVWAEGEFSVNGTYLAKWIREVPGELSDEELVQVREAAVMQAAHIALLPGNVNDWGEVLLNKHPECRTQENEYDALIAAALAERKDLFTDEDYEAY